MTSEIGLNWPFTKGVSSKKKYKSHANNSYTKAVTFEKWCKYFHEKYDGVTFQSVDNEKRSNKGFI